MHDDPGADREALLARIAELERLVEEFRREQIAEERLDFAWTGNLGHWYWNCQSNTVTFNPLKVSTLGYSLAEVPDNCPFQYFTEMLHPEDHDTAMQAMRDHLSGEKPVYETEYRIRTKDGGWRWYYDRGRITQRDDAGRPLLLAGIVFDVTERKSMERRLEDQNRVLETLATTDEVSQLLNRRTVLARLEHERARSERYGLPLSVLMLDIDHFKRVNDEHGHLAGDAVLAAVASAISREIRVIDFAGRYGGEEFLVAFPVTTLGQARLVAERIRRAAERLSFPQGLTVTLSGGLSEYHDGSIEQLIASADTLLYQAKQLGRNRIESETH